MEKIKKVTQLKKATFTGLPLKNFLALNLALA